MKVELGNSFKTFKNIIIVFYSVYIISQSWLFFEKLFILVLNKESDIEVSGIFNIYFIIV